MLRESGGLATAGLEELGDPPVRLSCDRRGYAAQRRLEHQIMCESRARRLALLFESNEFLKMPKTLICAQIVIEGITVQK